MLNTAQKCLADCVYAFLQTKVGKENAVSARELCERFGIPERELRDIIHYIRNSAEFVGVISSNNKGYFLCTAEEFARANKRLEKQAFSLLKVAYANRKKASRDGQLTFGLGTFCTQVIEAFGREEEESNAQSNTNAN